ncbi:MAG: corrinoid protein [Desulfitobacteriaceae bacterium]|nr:corrinoid protein [Desulfitobacteriaceae bacterium]MDI6878382.1 corrinoid protein [Desulfitobacteriaceae bacterium]MDI6913278.1 corrinoid protein [Desulfitobacteriaceae bacterium]
MANLLEEIQESVINGQAPKVKELTQKALDQGMEPQTILNEGLIPAMSTVGEKFQKGEFFISEMMISARAMYAGLNLVKPLLLSQKTESKGKAVVATVQGDLHDIGKNLVCMMLEGGGYEVVDLGVNVTPDKFVEAVKEHQPNFVMMSALLTTTMSSMEKTIKALMENGLREQVKIGVGGAPVTQRYADSIGADFYAADAGEAVSKANLLLNLAAK